MGGVDLRAVRIRMIYKTTVIDQMVQSQKRKIDTCRLAFTDDLHSQLFGLG